MSLDITIREQQEFYCPDCGRLVTTQDIDDGWVCVNSDSEYCTDWTDYDFVCPDWEEKE